MIINDTYCHSPATNLLDSNSHFEKPIKYMKFPEKGRKKKGKVGNCYFIFIFFTKTHHQIPDETAKLPINRQKPQSVS